jgi:hypothetical protein
MWNITKLDNVELDKTINSIEFMYIVKNELLCHICLELANNPVRLKIIDIRAQQASICNDIFCELCIIKMFYHMSKSYIPLANIKCPTCRRAIHITRLSDPINTYYIRDGISKNIIDLIKQYLTKFKLELDSPKGGKK